MWSGIITGYIIASFISAFVSAEQNDSQPLTIFYFFFWPLGILKLILKGAWEFITGW